ncbi:MAG: MCE family protein [Acidobacteriota bacterium]|nr:MCE family protein [Acidobacteriota bacterium]
MAQRKQLTWSELRVGIFVLAGLVILAVGILYVTGAGFFGPKYQLTTYVPEAGNIQEGAPVALDGVQVGNIASIRLTPRPKDRMHGVTIVMRVSKKYQPDIRTDSRASLVTEGLLGDRYVNITRGLTGTAIPDNGVVASDEVPDIKQVVQRGADLMQSLGALTDDVQEVVNKVQNGNGTLGRLMNDPSLYNHLNDTATRLDAVATSIQEGQGTLGKLTASDELYNKVDNAAGHLENVTAALSSQKGTLGKLIYDPSAYNNISGVAEKGNALLGDLRAGRGTLGKLATDDQLYTNLRDASANVRDVTGKMNGGQGTVGKFFTDPQLYDNMTGLTGDMRVLMNDFRKNPKKFLRIKLGIF